MSDAAAPFSHIGALGGLWSGWARRVYEVDAPSESIRVTMTLPADNFLGEETTRIGDHGA